MPDEKLLQFDVTIVQQEWHRGDDQIERLKGGLEINEATIAGSRSDFPSQESGYLQMHLSRVIEKSEIDELIGVMKKVLKSAS